MTPVLTKLDFARYVSTMEQVEVSYELVEGELVEMTPASPYYSDLVDYLGDRFKAEIQSQNQDWKVKSGDVGVKITTRTSRIPDLCVIHRSDWAALSGAIAAILTVSPLLIVEVVSPGEDNVRRDYGDKVLDYQCLGVPEYWIVDPRSGCFEVRVLTLKTGQYQSQIFTGDTPIQSITFPKLALCADDIFAAG